jgi:hypothetical protein
MVSGWLIFAMPNLCRQIHEAIAGGLWGVMFAGFWFFV